MSSELALLDELVKKLAFFLWKISREERGAGGPLTWDARGRGEGVVLQIGFAQAQV